MRRSARSAEVAQLAMDVFWTGATELLLAAEYAILCFFVLARAGIVYATLKIVLWFGERALHDDVARYPFVALWFERANIGLALVMISLSLWHASSVIYDHFQSGHQKRHTL